MADLEALLDEDDWDIREPGESLEDLCRYLCWDPNEGARKDLFKTAFLHLEESCNEILEEVYMQGWHTKFVNSWRSRHTSRKWNWVDLDDAAGSSWCSSARYSRVSRARAKEVSREASKATCGDAPNAT